MWYTWLALTLVSCARTDETTTPAVSFENHLTTTSPPTRQPLRTLDRQAGELAWRTWLQSPESRDPNAPPRRITTKSLFITPLICPKGQRYDQDGCVEVVHLDRNEHERYLLDQLNILFGPPATEDMYDYGDEEPGPFQLSIPIGQDLQAAPLQGQEPTPQAQDTNVSQIEVDKKDDDKANTDLSIEAELERLKFETTESDQNYTATFVHKVIDNFLPYIDKPKRDSANMNININATEKTKNSTDEGQKEVIFGNVSIDPMLYITEYQNKKTNETVITVTDEMNKTKIETQRIKPNNTQAINNTTLTSNSTNEKLNNSNSHELLNDSEKTKLNPENDSANIGETIKLISRYAEVTTDDSFAKDQKKQVSEDSTLGTRTRLQHRRNKVKPIDTVTINDEKNRFKHNSNENYYRYPWSGQHYPTPPPDYPFRHLQDYWPNRKHVGGIYNNGRENPRRHHHSYPHNTLRPHSYMDYSDYPSQQTGQVYPAQVHPGQVYPGQVHNGQVYPGQLYPGQNGRLVQHRVSPASQDLYSLLGLRHWFSDSTKR